MSDTDPQDVFIGRQPILDRNQQTFAYDLLFRSSGAGGENVASFLDGTQASATVAANAFTEFSVADALGPYQGFIKVDREFLFSDLINALPPQSVILEILESVEPTADVLQRCEQLRAAGFILATKASAQQPPQRAALLAQTEIIKIDISRIAPQDLSALVNQLNPLGKELLAEKVENSEQMQRCHDLGFDFFQGYYFAHPTIIAGKRLYSPQLALLRLLGLLVQDADTSEIEKHLKQEPVLTVNLLRLTNSASSGISTRITSLRHAITVLGRQQLMRWLQLLLYTSASTSRASANNPLLQLAATRGRMMELLAEGLQTANRKDRDFIDQAFMVGILSLMPVLLGSSIAEILCQLPVAERVQLALKEHSGTLGSMLALVEVTEHEGPVGEEALHELPGIDIRFLNSCLTQALSWANNLDRERS
jgi:EAL and modified HD-GYP domain-containing signal transduction protein